MDCPSPKRSAVAGLPEDAVLEILARVPARSLYRFKCVAKAWRDLIEDPLNRKRLRQTLQGFFFIDKEIYECRLGFAGLPTRSVHLQIDSSLSFLMTKLPGIEALTFLDSCNGLLLFEHTQKTWPYDPLGYVVCNPATEQWEVLARYDGPLPWVYVEPARYCYLVFDPSVSSHFHLVEWEFTRSFEKDGFVVDDDEEEEDGDEENDGYVHHYWNHREKLVEYSYEDDGEEEDEVEVEREKEEEEEEREEEEEGEEMDEASWTLVHVYSSGTSKWTHMQRDWSQIQSDQSKHDFEGWSHHGLIPRQSSWCAVLNGILHFIIEGQNQIAAVDVQGATWKIIPVPMAERKSWPKLGDVYVAQSQGHLQYIKRTSNGELLIWVLEDYDAQAWVLKHSVSFMDLFGKTRHYTGRTNDYSVVRHASRYKCGFHCSKLEPKADII
ncbi:unnamed protein product [Urochloa decumbens]|uniref:F-box domain-containing protein n=1 Tax=Urochloa decumbens TaxID=240449 RepID=A0ABC9GBL6_9POAL